MDASTTTPKLSSSNRGLCAVGGMVLFVLIGTASVLQPDSSGSGTHQQLGLPRCTTVQLFGVRCPSCGMTTSWAHTMNGEWSQALQANPAGTIACIQAMLTAPCLLFFSIRGSGTRGGWFSLVSVWIVVISLLIAFVHWGYLLAFS